MTTFAWKSSKHAPAPAPHQPTGTLAIEWSLALDAPAKLVITIADRAACAMLTVDGAEPKTVATGGPVRAVVAGGLEHIDVPGVVSLTLRRSAGAPPELLFARTPLLETLGARGGCIERPVVARC